MRKKNRGFTLTEMAMVMIISGTVMGMVLTALKMYNMSLAREATTDSLRQSRSAMMEFSRSNGGVYPCPADPTLAPGDAGYGVADCTAAGLITVPGRDVDGDGTGETVLIGMVPFTTMLPFLEDVDFSESEVIDGWGNKLEYAVTRSLTNALTFDDREGAIDVVDEFSQSVIDPPETAHMAVISHGPDGYGAFPRSGNERTDNCGVAVVLPPPPVGVIVPDIGQRENCDDDDARFLSGLRNESENYYNDDTVVFMLNQTYTLWQYTGTDTATNTNTGFVGVGVPDPQRKLHVAGDIRARAVMADDVCSGNNDDLPTAADPPNCLPLVNMVDGALDCPPGEVLTAFNRNDAECEPMIPAGTTITCPAGEVATGIIRNAGGSSLVCDTL